jgi:hypothetical protein
MNPFRSYPQRIRNGPRFVALVMLLGITCLVIANVWTGRSELDRDTPEGSFDYLGTWPIPAGYTLFPAPRSVLSDMESGKAAIWLPGGLPLPPRPFQPSLEVLPFGNESLNCTFPPLVERPPPAYLFLTYAVAFPGPPIIVTKSFSFFTASIHDRKVPQLPLRSGLRTVEDAVVLFHPNAGCYGHLINEIIPGFLAIPDDIWKRSVFYILRTDLKTLTLELLGLCGKKAMSVENFFHPIFVRRLYVPRPCIFLNVWPDALRAMRARVFSRLGLEDVIPQKRVIIQRSRNRVIFNINETFDSLVNEYPGQGWMILGPKPKSVMEQITFYANTAILVFVRGSGGANVAWMRQKSVMIEIQTHVCESYYAQVARAMGVKAFEVSFPRGNRYYVTIQIPFLMEVIRRAEHFIRSMGDG